MTPMQQHVFEADRNGRCVVCNWEGDYNHLAAAPDALRALDPDRLTAIIESRMSRDLAWLRDDGKTVDRFGPEQTAWALAHLYATGDVVSGLPALAAPASEGLREAAIDQSRVGERDVAALIGGESRPATTLPVTDLREAATELMRACETREPIDEVRVRMIALKVRAAIAASPSTVMDLMEQKVAAGALGALDLAAPAVPAAIDVERLARALAHYKPDKSWMQRHNSWSRPDPADAAAIAAAYEQEK